MNETRTRKAEYTKSKVKTLARQKLDVVTTMWGNPALRVWRGQFAPDSKPLEFEGFEDHFALPT